MLKLIIGILSLKIYCLYYIAMVKKDFYAMTDSTIAEELGQRIEQIRLEKNVRANVHAANIKTMMAAAAADEGFLEFEYSDSGFCNGGRHESIPAIKHGHPFKQEVFCVDIEKELREDYSDLLPKLKFIKVDAEGYDLYVLQSMIGMIREYKPAVKAEVFKKTDSRYRRKLLSLFRELGYSVHRIVEELIGLGPLVTEKNLNEHKHYDILCTPDRSI